ncbi:LSU ribosomal protein L7AE [Nucleospora cyclopteri]
MLGIQKKVEKKQKVDPVKRAATIKTKINKLKSAIKIPAPINQFNTQLKGVDEEKLISLFSKYSPETKKEKRDRLASSNPKAGPKPIIIKFGMKHIVSLIKRKQLKLLVIAADVSPITTVVFLPTLCKKMNIPYAIVEKQSKLGDLVHLKRTAAVGLENVRAEDEALFKEVIQMSNSVFSDQYEKHMSTIGGKSVKINKLE